MKKTLSIVKKVAIALVLVALIVIGLILYAIFGVLMGYYNVPNENKYVTPYDHATMQLISDELYNEIKDEPKLELGINEAGELVFQHPYKAFGKAKSMYKEGWKFLDKECEYKHLSRTFYLAYIDAAPVVAQNGGTDKQVKDVELLGQLFTIYRNSYNKAR